MHPRRNFSGSPLPALALASALLGAAGCGQPPGQQIALIAAQAKTSRTTATSAIIAALKAGQVTHEDLINAAHDRLEAGEDATAFAGAVLDALQAVDSTLPQGAEFEIFWRRIARLAFWAANTAYVNKRPDEALSLVFAGPKRWQNEPYWLRYPDHDALASIILDANGRRNEAIARLNERSVLDGDALTVHDRLTGHK